MLKHKGLIKKVGGLVVLFCVGFTFFYGYFVYRSKRIQPSLPSSVLNKRIPETHLIDASGAELKSAEIQRGRVILVLVTPECDYSLDEAKFLEKVINKRSDVRFYGVIPFGAGEEVLTYAQQKFPFKTFFDDGFLLGRELNVKQVPIKIYLEDGIIKKTWVGSTVFYHAEDAFIGWLDSLS